MKRTLVLVLSALLIASVMFGCGTNKKHKRVARVASDEVVDLSGRWNDTDSQMVSETMIKDCLSFPWIEDFMGANGGNKPVTIVGRVVNKSHEHINTETFVKDLERAFIRSGRVRVVSNAAFREWNRKERAGQAEGWTDPNTMASIGNELGANFMLFGTINTIIDEAGGMKVVFYQTNLELHNLTTTEKVWIGDKKIKKVIERDAKAW